MKSIYLLRHAKSSWKDPGLADHDRPLNKRGRHTAKLIGSYLTHAKIAPDVVICSTATRAQQTLGPIMKAAKKPPEVILTREIYGGMQEALWEQLRNLAESVESVLLIGHNPALQEFAQELAGAGSSELPRLSEKFPTGALASFHFDGKWEALAPHGAVLVSFVTPKAIAGDDTSQRQED